LGSDPPTEPELTALFRDHADGLAGAVRGVLGPRADVAEVLQESFLGAWRAVRKGHHPRDPVAWVFVLTLNKARDQRRREVRRPRALDLDEVQAVKLTTHEPEPATRLAHAESLAAAKAAIYGLAEREKEVFLLRVSGGLSFGAIADALGIPVGTAKTCMRSALRELRGSLRAFAPESAPELEGETR
jgi:RNA polymerase sigma-70 factor (ECF subfamily)